MQTASQDSGVRTPRVFRVPGQQREQGNKWVTPPLPHEGRVEREDRQWLDTFEKFRALWIQRTTDVIEREHPFEYWVWKQRKRHRDNRLPQWRLDLLKGIGFPLMASRLASQLGNMDHALSLHAFFLKNGNYAPTITFAGGALTHWVRRMRESNGTFGIVTDEPGTAAKADAYLRQHIPEFAWPNTVKRGFNHNRGLTHNGFQHSMGLKGASRSLEVVRRARASLWFRLNPERLDEALHGLAMNKFLQRCRFYEQAARVCISGDHDERIWWLEGVSAQEANNQTLTLELVRCEHESGSRGPLERKSVNVDADWTQEAGYSDDGGLYMLVINNAEDNQFICLDMDVARADQTHLGVHPRKWSDGSLWGEQVPTVDWGPWTDPKTFPAKCASPNSTANVAFTHNLIMLKEHLEEKKATKRLPVHVGFGSIKLFKFLEHMHRKASNGVSQPSQMERLSELHFTWGEHKASAWTLFSREADVSGCALSLKVAPQLGDRDQFDLASPRHFESCRHAFLYILALAKHASDAGKKLMCRGEEQQWAYFHAVKPSQWGLAIEYTYEDFQHYQREDTPDDAIYGTEFTPSDVTRMAVTKERVSGFDVDGEEFELFLTTESGARMGASDWDAWGDLA